MSVNPRPTLVSIEINKSGSTFGEFLVNKPDGTNEVRLVIQGSLPVSKTDSEPSAKEDFVADTVRQALFETICHALRIAFDGVHAPYRFFDKNGTAYNLDSSSTYWLLKTGRWEEVHGPEHQELMLRFKQDTRFIGS